MIRVTVSSPSMRLKPEGAHIRGAVVVRCSVEHSARARFRRSQACEDCGCRCPAARTVLVERDGDHVGPGLHPHAAPAVAAGRRDDRARDLAEGDDGGGRGLAVVEEAQLPEEVPRPEGLGGVLPADDHLHLSSDEARGKSCTAPHRAR